MAGREAVTSRTFARVLCAPRLITISLRALDARGCAEVGELHQSSPARKLDLRRPSSVRRRSRMTFSKNYIMETVQMKGAIKVHGKRCGGVPSKYRYRTGEAGDVEMRATIKLLENPRGGNPRWSTCVHHVAFLIFAARFHRLPSCV